MASLYVGLGAGVSSTIRQVYGGSTSDVGFTQYSSISESYVPNASAGLAYGEYYDAYASTTSLTAQPVSGYVFLGWYTIPAGSNVATLSNATVLAESSETITYSKIQSSTNTITDTGGHPVHIFFSKWGKVCTVTLDAQGGSGGTPSVTVATGSAMPSATMPTRAGYTFGGYFTERNGGGAQYYNADGSSARTWDKTTDTTLYAYWIRIPYELMVVPNGGTYGSAPGNDMPQVITTSVKLYVGSQNFNNLGTLPVRAGYTFLGWFTEASGGTQIYGANGACLTVAGFWSAPPPSGVYQRADNLTVFAHWKYGDDPSAANYTVFFDPNGGEVSPSTDMVREVPKDTAVGSLPSASRDGFTFSGWYTAKTGGSQVTSATVVSADSTYYARWTAAVPPPAADQLLLYFERDGSLFLIYDDGDGS